MALSFPTSPSVGQVYQNWQWNGTAWVPAPASNIGPIAIRVFTSSGTYTPSVGMQSCIVECLGGGASGAGLPSGMSTSNTYTSPGGGGGAYSRRRLTAAQVGASQPITIGAGGVGPSGNAMNPGGDTYLGASGSPLCLAKGGQVGSGPAGVYYQGGGGQGGSAALGVGDVCTSGAPGGAGLYGVTGITAGAGACFGGGSALGGGAPGPLLATAGGNYNGLNALGPGGAGSGCYSQGGGGPCVGGSGAAGICIVTEFATGPTGSVVPVSGQRLLLAQQTVSAPVATVNFTAAGMAYGGLANTSFDEFQLDCINFAIDTNGISPCVQVSLDGGSTFDTAANYAAVSLNISTAATSTAGGPVNYWAMMAGLYFASTRPAVVHTAKLTLWRPWSTTLQKNVRFQGFPLQSTPQNYMLEGAGYYPILGSAALGAITGLRVLLSGAGNFTAGTFKLWGVQN